MLGATVWMLGATMRMLGAHLEDDGERAGGGVPLLVPDVQPVVPRTGGRVGAWPFYRLVGLDATSVHVHLEVVAEDGVVEGEQHVLARAEELGLQARGEQDVRGYGADVGGYGVDGLDVDVRGSPRCPTDRTPPASRSGSGTCDVTTQAT
eukprot:1182132-Prorocentrum_minimum.AAC.3